MVCVPDGQRHAVWDRFTGACRFVDGPQRFWSAGARVEKLELHAAAPAEYLKVSFLEGGVEFIRGPASLRHDPMQHRSVTVMPALEVGSNEVVVVYRDVGSGKGGVPKVQRTVLHGPTFYVPNGLEWLHQFSWHGVDKIALMDEVQRRMPGLLRFKKLRLVPDQMYFDVPDVRTRDDALITVKLMLFLRLTDVERMLDATHDPVSEFTNAISADVIDFIGSRQFEQFKCETDALNALSTYPSLAARATFTGFELSKVVFRGYVSSPRLQEMHDEAINKRTELKLQKETQEQQQDLLDFKLQRDSQRAERLADFKLQRAKERQAIQLDSKQNNELLLDLGARAQLDRELHAHKQALEVDAELHQQSLRHRTGDDERNAKHYAALLALGVDLSRYLPVVARGAPHRVIEIDGGTTPGRTQLHVHSADGPATE